MSTAAASTAGPDAYTPTDGEQTVRWEPDPYHRPGSKPDGEDPTSQKSKKSHVGKIVAVVAVVLAFAAGLLVALNFQSIRHSLTGLNASGEVSSDETSVQNPPVSDDSDEDSAMGSNDETSPQEPPEFYLNTGEITDGGIVVLSGVNVTDPDDCKITVAPTEGKNAASYTYTPKFFRDGDHVRALIPVSIDFRNGECDYTVTVTTGQNAYTMQFTAKAAGEASPATKNIGMDIYLPAGSQVMEDPYDVLYEKIAGAISSVTDFSTGDMAGEFVNSCKGYEGIRGVYGTIINYATLGVSVVSHDNYWAGNKYTTLYAMHSGRVVYVGSASYTGGLVVVDHGHGLLSWYWNLRTIEPTITVGVTVESGDTIGNIGGGSFSEVYNNTYISAHTALTVFGTPVNSLLFENGVNFGDTSSTRVNAVVTAK